MKDIMSEGFNIYIKGSNLTVISLVLYSEIKDAFGGMPLKMFKFIDVFH